MKTVTQPQRIASLSFSKGRDLLNATLGFKWLGVLCCAGLLSLGTAPVSAAGTTIVDWKFTADEDWESNNVESLTDAGWSVNTAANSNDAFFVDTDDGVLRLWDNVSNGKPTVSYTFGQGILAGQIDLTAAINQVGSTDTDGRIILRSGNTDLARIRLLQSGTLQFRYKGSVDGQETISNVVPGANSLKQYSLNWTVDADGTNSKLALAVDGDVLFENVGFLVDLIPDSLLLEVGFGGATDRQLYLGELSIVAVPESSTTALLLGASAIGFVLIRRRVKS